MTELFGETTEDLYDQFLNLDVATTAAFTVTDANGNTARYVKVPDVQHIEVPDKYPYCHDCAEYDEENHCCHRFSTVLREAVAELNQVYGADENGCDGKDYCEINVGGTE